MKIACPNCYSSDLRTMNNPYIPEHIRIKVDGYSGYQCRVCNCVFIDTVNHGIIKLYIGFKRRPACAICKTEKNIKEFVNPHNSYCRDYYCKKHSPECALKKFEELCQFTKVKSLNKKNVNVNISAGIKKKNGWRASKYKKHSDKYFTLKIRKVGKIEN